MTLIGLDTNIVVRWLLDDSIIGKDAPEQKRQVATLMERPSARFLVNHVVIAETIWVLRNRVGRSKAQVKSTVNRLLDSRDVFVDQERTVKAALESFIEHPGDFADHLIGRINADAGCKTTLTFDKAATKSPDFTNLEDFQR